MNAIDFVALDVETANKDASSICQIGMAGFKDGILVREWASLINPEAEFLDFNINIHGLTTADVTEPRLYRGWFWPHNLDTGASLTHANAVPPGLLCSV